MVTNVMLNQYPHYLYVRSNAGEATQNENGSWEEAASTWALHSRCREETNGKGTQLATTGGKYVTFASLIQLPAGTDIVPIGAEVAIADEPIDLTTADLSEASANGDIRVTGTCLKFDKGRLHCRLWV